MYIQITTRCNMECEHGAYSCTSDGVDMSMDILKQALTLAEERGDCISIGGGEPTIHPYFWEIIGLCLGCSNDDIPVWLATNGKETETALRLARLAKKSIISVDLSRDLYHEWIEQSVVDAFTVDRTRGYMSGGNDDYRGIRDVTDNGRKDPSPFGRAKDWASPEQIMCVCDDLFVTPDGRLFACGCQKKQYGTVFNPEIPEDIDDGWCSENYEGE